MKSSFYVFSLTQRHCVDEKHVQQVSKCNNNDNLIKHDYASENVHVKKQHNHVF